MMKAVAKPFPLRKYIFGDGQYRLIIPIAAKTGAQLHELVREFLDYEPDMLEWRLDFLENLDHKEEVIALLHELRKQIKDIPLLATIRHPQDDGARETETAYKCELYEALAQTGEIDLMDIELRYEERVIHHLKHICNEHGVALVISCHEQTTPEADEIRALFARSIALGADVCKVSLQAQNYSDIARMAETVREIRTWPASVPMIAISGGSLGMITRVFGDFFGSDAEFVSTGKTGQIHIDDVRALRAGIDGS